uniref:CASP-like protein n=1 Tax=Fagus sylvatica TaxID=28930 RepID=A0A2N9I0E9_FAGSY
MNKTMRIFTLLLRLLALGATLAATILMVTSHDSAEVLNLTFEAKYSNESAFKYYVIAEAIASGYSLIVLFVSSKSLLWRLILILDVVITMLLTSSVSASLAIARVGKKGNSHAGWLPICGQVHKFCNQVTGALVAGLVATIIYLVLLLYSLHSVYSPLFTTKP